MQERLDLLQDLKGVLKHFCDDLTARYLLVIRPKIMLEDMSLEMQMNDIKSTMEEQHKSTSELIDEKFKIQILDNKVQEGRLDKLDEKLDA